MNDSLKISQLKLKFAAKNGHAVKLNATLLVRICPGYYRLLFQGPYELFTNRKMLCQLEHISLLLNINQGYV